MTNAELHQEFARQGYHYARLYGAFLIRTPFQVGAIDYWRGRKDCTVMMGFEDRPGAAIVSQVWPKKTVFVKLADLRGFLRAHGLSFRKGR